MSNSTQLAVQLYTLRDYTKTPADIASTFEKLAKQGWKAVQDSAMGEISTEELKKIADDNGITIAASHVSLEQIEEDAQKVIDRHAALGVKYSAVGGYFPADEDYTVEKWTAFIDRFNAAAEKLKGSGLRYGYHNHSHEWIHLGDPLSAPRPIDLILEKLSPESWIELDTYWIAHAGGSPVSWIEKVAGRMPCIHLKDMIMSTPGRTQKMAEIGVGNLDWASILPACKAAGVEWYIVEEDHCWRDPFDSLKTSLDNLQAMGMK